MNILSATVAQVQIGKGLAVEGLRLEDGRYAIAVPQVAALFPYFSQHSQDIQNTGARDLKRLMGKGFKTSKIKTVFNRNATLAIDLLDFERVLRRLDRLGDAVAQAMSDALIGTALHQFFADAFNVILTKEDRQTVATNCILDQPNPWELMYTREFCDIVVGWFGVNFFWDFCYSFMTAEERAKLNLLNPAINGDRIHRIHQYLEPATKERLTLHVTRLSTLVLSATSRQNFLESYAKVFNRQWQQNLDLDM